MSLSVVSILVLRHYHCCCDLLDHFILYSIFIFTVLIQGGGSEHKDFYFNWKGHFAGFGKLKSLDDSLAKHLEGVYLCTDLTSMFYLLYIYIYI